MVSIALLAGNTFASDAQWQEGFFTQRGAINAMVADERGRIFVGGDFFTIDGGTTFPGTRNLAEGDGERWWSVGGGVNGKVTALALRGTDLFVAGTFSLAGTVAATNLARWDGTNWWPVGGGVNGTINVIAINGNDLYVGGNYTRAGDLAVNSIAKWDGATWSDIGGVYQGGNPGTVWGTFVESNKVYVSGTFDRVGNVSATKVAVWDGTTWEPMGLGTNAVPSEVPGVVTAFGRHPSSGRFFAGGGEVYTEDGCPVFEWTGTQWIRTPLRSNGDNNGVRGMVCFGGDLYVGAGFFSFSRFSANLYDSIAKFDGTNWTIPSTPFEYFGVSAMAVTSNRLFAAGNSGVPLSKGLPSVMHYDGGEWEVVGKGSPYQVQGVAAPYSIRTLARHQGSIVAGGRLTLFDTDCIGAWNGRIWSSVGPRRQSQCTEVFALLSRGNTLYSGGEGGLRIWNGSNWVTVPQQGFMRIRALEIIGTDIYCGTTSGLWKWNGSSWQQLPFNGGVNALLFDGEVLYAGGRFSLVEGVEMRNIARWDGFAWEPLSVGVNGTVICFTKRGNKLYVGGEFTTAGGLSAQNIAVWDNNTWSEVGGGVSTGSPGPAAVRALEFSGQGLLYAGGNFTFAGGQPANFIAAWNGVEWKNLGAGMNWIVEDLLWDGNKLYACGLFNRAGQSASSQIAVWHEAPALKWSHLRSSNELTISWPSVFSNYVLEATGELVPGQWRPLTEALTVSGGERKVTNSVSDPQKFFRLRRQ